jgi:hypothetical protein
MTMALREFQLVLLRRPPKPSEYDGETSARIQRDHLAYYAGLRASGVVVTNGPMRDQPDESLRGLVIFATESLDRARETGRTRSFGSRRSSDVRAHDVVVPARHDDPPGAVHHHRRLKI